MSSEGVPCPWDGCEETYPSERVVKIHHANKHGESIAGVEVECANCGKPKRVKEYKYENESRFFCDINCKSEWQKGNMRGENNPRWTERISIECEYCGEEFQCPKDKAPERRFCGLDCFDEFKSENWSGKDHPAWKSVKKTCQECGGEYYIEECNAEVSRFCSLECRGKDHRGEGNPNWDGGYDSYYGPSWEDWKMEIRSRDDKTCQNCGLEMESSDMMFDVHHFLRVNGFDDPEEAHYNDNLVLLCRSCHSRLEYIPVEKQLESINKELSPK